MPSGVSTPPAGVLFDVAAARRAGLDCVCVLSGGIAEADLREAGAVAVYRDVAHLLTELDGSPLAPLFRAVACPERRTAFHPVC